jgi:hypothetical protein
MKFRLSGAHAQTALHTLQAIAIVIGGCWIVFRYLSHERDLAGLNRKQLEIAVADQREQQRLTAEQLRLSNQQLAIVLGDQRKQQELATEQAELANEQARLTLTVETAQQDLRIRELEQTVALHERDVQLRELESKKVQHEVSYSGRYRFDRSFSLSSRKLRDLSNGMAEYEVTYSFAFTNKSQVPFEISVYVVDYYLGRPRELPNDSRPTFRRLATPNLRSTPNISSQDAIEWEHMGSTGGIYGNPRIPFWTHSPRTTLIRNAMATGQVKPEQSTNQSMKYFVTAPPNSYITFFLSYCFNGCHEDVDDYTNSYAIPLEEAESDDEVPRFQAPTPTTASIP